MYHINELSFISVTEIYLQKYQPSFITIIILEHKTPRAYTKTYVGIVRIGVRISRLAILTTKYTLHTSIPCHVYNSLTLKVFFTAFDAITSLYDSDTCSTVDSSKATFTQSKFTAKAG